MNSKLQHLQLAKLHPSTRVANTKSVEPVGLGHQVLKAFAINPSDHARVSRQSFAIVFLFLFFFLSFSFLFPFFFFAFGRHIGLLFMGVLNLLKVVNETRVGYCKVKEVGSFSAY